MTPNVDGPVGRDRALVLGINKNGHEKEEQSDKSTTFHFHGGGKAVVFSSDELQHIYLLICMRNSISFFGASKKKRSRL